MTTEIILAHSESMEEAVDKAEKLLAAGELVGLPTETVYGLGADALNPNAVAKVFEVKQRPSFDPLIVHIASRDDIHQVAKISEELAPTVNALIQAHWPGPLTMVLPKQDCVPDIVTSGLSNVAVRMSNHEVFNNILKKFGGPVAAPSANKFGRISPTSAAAVAEELEGEIPLIVDAGACLEGIESTIIRVEEGENGRAHLHLLRPGPVTKEELQKVGKVVRKKKKSARLLAKEAELGEMTVAQEAPGMSDSHYAPATPLFLYEKPEDFIPEAGKKYGLLSYRGQEKDGYLGAHEWAHVEELSPGKGKLAEAAVRLFYCMRALDYAELDAIVVEPISEVGLGVAIMDRLRRASVI